MSKEKIPSPTVLDLERSRGKATGYNVPRVWGELRGCNAHRLRALCIARGIVTGKLRNGEAAERRLQAMLEKSHSQAVVYDGYGWADLKDFVQARGLKNDMLSSLWEKIANADVEKAAMEVEALERKKETEREREKRAIAKKERQQAENKSEKVQAGKAAAEIPQAEFVKPTKQSEMNRHEDTDAGEGPKRPAKKDDIPDSGTLPRRSRRLAGGKSLGIIPLTVNKPDASRTAVIRRTTKPGSKYPAFAARHPPSTIRVNSRKIVSKPDAGACFLKRQARELAISVLEAGDREARFNFLGLPTELRNIVYHSVCRASTAMFSPRQPAITRTCRLIREESIPVYYGHNRFGILTSRVRNFGLGRHGFDFVAENPWLETQLDVNLMRVRSFEFRRPRFDRGLWIDFKSGVNDYEVKHRYLPWDFNSGRFSDRTDVAVLEGELDFVREHAGYRAQFASMIENAIGGNSTAVEMRTLASQYERAEGYSATSLIQMANILVEYGHPTSGVYRLWEPPRTSRQIRA